MTEEMRALLILIDNSFRVHRGTPLLTPAGIVDRLSWLHTDAPYSLLAHDGSEDPRFIYANHCALRCFNYTQQQMLGMPSRFSASEEDREERKRLLDIVNKNGIADNYQGPRIDSQGKRFMIYDGIVWQVYDEQSALRGQAALFWPQPHDGQWLI